MATYCQMEEPVNPTTVSTPRARARRADLNHQWIDPILVGAPWVLAGLGAVAALRTLRKHRPA